jgi:hypothetical protein
MILVPRKPLRSGRGSLSSETWAAVGSKPNSRADTSYQFGPRILICLPLLVKA